MGSDGSLGIKAIKDKNGIVLVQDPNTAKFDSMPSNALLAVKADIVDSAEELPAKLITFLHVKPVIIPQLEIELTTKKNLQKNE